MRHRALFVSILVALLAVAWRRWTTVGQDDGAAFFSMPPIARGRTTLLPMNDIVQQTLIERDPFRIARRPASVPFESAPGPVLPQAGSSPIARYRPTMTLRAIAGPPWRALIDGVPGEQRMTVVQPGSALDRLVVRSVSRDRVVIAGPDTTWVLELGARR